MLPADEPSTLKASLLVAVRYAVPDVVFTVLGLITVGVPFV
jgi:hypothetical protein